MWVLGQKNQIINLNIYKIIHIENDKLIARNGREYQIIFDGEQEICEELYYKIIDGLTMDVPLLDLKIIK